MNRRALLARSRLYFVLEARPHGAAPDGLLEAALRGGVDVVQLRDKELSDDDLVAAAEPFRRACDAHGALFLLDDRPHLVERCGADGVHVGQSDVSVREARRAVGPDRLVGLSASTRDELVGASAEADYVGVGAIFATPTKPESSAGGLELVQAARDVLRVPWFAIGGVDRDTVEAIVAAGAPGVAVVRALRDADDAEATARALRAALPPAQAIVCGPGSRTRALLPQLDLVEAAIAPGERVAPHTHRVCANAFYVLEGELEFRLGDETVRVPAGTCVVAPPSLLHGFRNPTNADARYLELHTPARSDSDTFGPEESSAQARAVVVGPGDGERLVQPHRLALVKAHLPEIELLEYVVDGEYGGADAHIHLRHVDGFYVLQGTLELRVDGATIRAEAGTSVIVPPGVVHAFTSVGNARFLNLHAPHVGVVDAMRTLDAGREVDATQHDAYEIG